MKELPESVRSRLRQAPAPGEHPDADVLAAFAERGLSQREREIVRHVALGYTNAQIAKLLFLSERTVKTYRARAVSKLGCSGRAELTAYARAHRLID